MQGLIVENKANLYKIQDENKKRIRCHSKGKI